MHFMLFKTIAADRKNKNEAEEVIRTSLWIFLFNSNHLCRSFLLGFNSASLGSSHTNSPKSNEPTWFKRSLKTEEWQTASNHTLWEIKQQTTTIQERGNNERIHRKKRCKWWNVLDMHQGYALACGIKLYWYNYVILRRCIRTVECQYRVICGCKACNTHTHIHHCIEWREDR